MSNELTIQQSVAMEIQLEQRLGDIFMPFATPQRKRLFRDDPDKQFARFAHYTSADAALKIIKSKRLWMRSTTCMSDYREVQHGFEIVGGFLQGPHNLKAFSDALNSCSPGAAEESINIFKRSGLDTLLNTFITSISEHDDSEDLHGRLSMWRAFGNAAPRVAIVFKVPKFTRAVDSLNLLFSPTAYLAEPKAHEALNAAIENINREAGFLRSLGSQQIVNWAFHMLWVAVTCLKHEGFHEEREWRAIYSPARNFSELMKLDIEIIGGIPQRVYKIPLDGSVSPAVADLDFSRVFDRLIIGPSSYGVEAMADAFVRALQEAGVPQAKERVRLSEIPLRFG